jgi:hypothetical protein
LKLDRTRFDSIRTRHDVVDYQRWTRFDSVSGVFFVFLGREDREIREIRGKGTLNGEIDLGDFGAHPTRDAEVNCGLFFASGDSVFVHGDSFFL